MIPDLRPLLKIERQVQFWFDTSANRQAFGPDRLPVHLWAFEPERFFYGFPDLGDGCKVARHHEGTETDPGSVERAVSEGEVESMRALLRAYVPGAAGELRQAAVCLYTNTDDGHFIIAPHPGHDRVLIVSPCSGHGFKFSSAIGELAAEWAREGKLSKPAERFSLPVPEA